MPEFRIDIKTSADLKAAQDLQRSLEDQSKAAKSLGLDTSDLDVSLKSVGTAMESDAAKAIQLAEAQKKTADAMRRTAGESQNAADSLSEAGETGAEDQNELAEAADKAGRSFADNADLAGTFGGVVTKVGMRIAGVTGAVAALVGTINSIGSAAVDAENVGSKLSTALSNQGLLSEEYFKQLQELASGLEDVTAIADTQWLGVLKELTIQGSKPESIGMDVEAVKNLAGLLDGDLRQASELIGRAINGNFDQFNRLGISIDANATQAEKLNQAYQALAIRGGGQLEAITKNLHGTFSQLKNGLGRLSESIGLQISGSGLLQRSFYGLGETAKELAGMIGGTVQATEGLVNASTSGAESLDKEKKAAEELKTALAEASKAQSTLTEMTVARVRAEQEIADTELAGKLASVDIEERDGRILGSEAVKLRAAIQKQHAEEKFRREQQLDQQLLESKKKELDEARKLVKTIETRVAKAKEELALTEAATNAENKMKLLQKKLDNALDRSPGGIKGDDGWAAWVKIFDPENAADESENLLYQHGKAADEYLKKRRRFTKRSSDVATGSAELEAARENLKALEASNLPEIDKLELNISTRGITAPKRIETQDRRAESEYRERLRDEQERARKEEEQRRKEQLDRIKSGQPSASIDSSAGSQSVANVSTAAKSASAALDAVASATVQGFQAFELQAQGLTKQIATMTEQIRILDRRQGAQRLS